MTELVLEFPYIFLSLRNLTISDMKVSVCKKYARRSLTYKEALQDTFEMTDECDPMQ